MIGIDIKIRNNKITYLSKFLFLKNPKIPSGKKIKNIGKTARAVDFIKENTASSPCIILAGDNGSV